MSAGSLTLWVACGEVEKVTPDADGVNTDASMDASIDAPPAPVDAAQLEKPTIALVAGSATVVHGGAGTDASPRSCPAGQVLTGFVGSTGTFAGSTTVVGGLLGQCSTLAVGAQTTATGFALSTSAGAQLTALGIVTNQSTTFACPSGQVIIGAEARGNSALDQIAFQCAPLSVEKQDAAWKVVAGAVTLLPPLGGTGGDFRSLDCTLGEVATTVLGRTDGANGIVAAAGLGCSSVTAK